MKGFFTRLFVGLTLCFFAAGIIYARPAEEGRRADRQVAIVAERFNYVPSRVMVKPGQTIEFVLSSEDTYHGFFIRELGVDVLIPPLGKGEARVLVRFEKAGRYVFECSRPCGAGHNAMRGQIVVK